MTNESTIINNDSPLPIPRQLARWLGLNEAGVLQQLHFHTEKEHGQMIDGVRWIRMSETEWLEEIPLDEKAIQRAIKNLVNDGLIQSKALPGMGRCKWYTINYEAVDSLVGPVERIAQKSEIRKQARASHKSVKEQIVPIVINPIDTVDSNGYAKAKEQSVPTQPARVKEQNVTRWEQSVPIVWEQNVPLQDKSQDSSRDSLILNARTCEILDRIGALCKTNFSNPKIEPFRTSLFNACRKYTPQKVLWAIEVALSPEKANGKPKTWGYVLGILESDRDGSYEARKNGAKEYGHNRQHDRPLQRTGEALEGEPTFDPGTSELVWPDGHRSPAMS